MQFNTYLFAVFFAVVVAIHRAPLPWGVKKWALLVESYLFYAAWDPAFVVLLWASTVIDWYVAKAMARADDPARRKLLLAASLVFNLGMLGYFKYAGFLQQTLAGALDVVGVSWTPTPLSIALPIGISFYTFMTISYTIDVYLRRAAPAKSALDYALYVTFFPHLVSGPIVRADELVPQFETPRQATGEQFGWGLALVVLGLFEKVVLADGFFAPVVDRVYGTQQTASALPVGTFDAWLGTLAFAGQIVSDFAGYSTCAIGVALCLGFYLPENFRFPYAAIGFSDFWRRWHISLSTWLRDYVYIPLGGNRRGPTRTHVNLMATMLIGGLWHGASWTFVVWGGLHGLYLVGERVVKRMLPEPGTALRALGWAVTFALVCVAWVFFRATSFPQAFAIVRAMVGLGATASVHANLAVALVPLVGLIGMHVVLRDQGLERAVERTPWPVVATLLAAMTLSLALFPGVDRAFIYFQF